MRHYAQERKYSEYEANANYIGLYKIIQRTHGIAKSGWTLKERSSYQEAPTNHDQEVRWNASPVQEQIQCDSQIKYRLWWSRANSYVYREHEQQARWIQETTSQT